MSATVAAVDLGASSGRVIVGRVDADRLELQEVSRFANGPVLVGDTLYWDILGLYRGVLEGLGAAHQEVDTIDSIGIDSWGVDYGLLDSTGALVANPVHHRDQRTDGVVEHVAEMVPAARIYATTGLQFLPINTLYQLVANAGSPQMDMACRLLLVPDLLTYWLTGIEGSEITNASTTQLLDIRERRWATDLMAAVGIDPTLFPPLHEPGTQVGELQASACDAAGLDIPPPVVAVGSHDTASAVVGVPAETPHFAYISCGTWSLVGVELTQPVLTQASRRANFSNELGVDGRIRYLRNVMGLWLLQESLRTWQVAGHPVDLDTVLGKAAQEVPFAAVIDPDDARLLPPGDMPARIAESCRRTGQAPPNNPAAVVRCILDSLALGYRRAVRTAQELSGSTVDVVHMVGGGVHNTLLCQLTADACQRPVLAGPVEATALGNVLVQARALGAIHGDLTVLRALLRRTQHLQRYEPSGDGVAWGAAESRLSAPKP